MPKIYVNEYERRISAFRRWHKGRRAEEDVSQADLARELGIGQTAVSAKLKIKGSGQSVITYRDLLCFFKAVNATDEEIVRFMRL